MRDASFIQIFSENSQDSYDNLLQGIKIAESVRLPAIVSNDGFITSHNLEALEILKDEEAYKFIGDFKPAYSVLDIKNPITVNPLALPDSFMEIKKSQALAMAQAKKMIAEIGRNYQEITGRKYGFFREFKLDDAEIAIIVMGSTAETAQIVVDQLRDTGIKAGILSLRVFRPFPKDEIAKTLSKCKAICVMDRADGYSGNGGPLFVEVAAALQRTDLCIISRIYGLGGREINEEMISLIFKDLKKLSENKKVKKFDYVGSA